MFSIVYLSNLDEITSTICYFQQETQKDTIELEYS